VRFQASVRGGSRPLGVRYELSPAVGAISDDGLYVAPEDAEDALVQVTAVSINDPSKTATAQIRVRAD